MTILYVQEQGSMVRKKDNQVLVTKEGEKPRVMPIEQIEQVVLMGRGVQISTALLIDLVKRGIPVTLTNQHGSFHYVTIAESPSRFGELRMQQTAFVSMPQRALDLGRRIIRAKLTNQRNLLATTRWANAPSAIAKIDAMAVALERAATMDELRGYEGAGADAYFEAWKASLPPAWGFLKRDPRPPKDPINAMLSFGYTLALHDVLTAIQITGLDPYLGTFHSVQAGRPSLALDLLEEFRPVAVDRLVLDLVRTNAITPQRFEHPPEEPSAVYLDPPGRATFVERYHILMRSTFKFADGRRMRLRDIILLQAQALARVMRGEQAEYVGYTP